MSYSVWTSCWKKWPVPKLPNAIGGITDYRRKIPPIWQSEKPWGPLNFSMRTFKYFDHIGYAMLTSRQYFFFKLPQINFNNKNNISECSQNAKKHCYADVHKMQRTFLSKYSQNAKKTFLCQLPMLTNCLSNCSAGRG